MILWFTDNVYGPIVQHLASIAFPIENSVTLSHACELYKLQR